MGTSAAEITLFLPLLTLHLISTKQRLELQLMLMFSSTMSFRERNHWIRSLLTKRLFKEALLRHTANSERTGLIMLLWVLSLKGHPRAPTGLQMLNVTMV